MTDTILIVDFGSQYTQLIARRVRELNVYCEIVPFHRPLTPAPHVRGVILSGSPASVAAPGSPQPDLRALLGTLPVLGICYGAQLITHQLGGHVAPSAAREYGRAQLQGLNGSPLFQGLEQPQTVWMSHSDTILQLPAGYHAIARTESIPVAAFAAEGHPTYGLQFHPEVTHTPQGRQMLANFVLHIAGAQPHWTPAAFVAQAVAEAQQALGPEAHAVCALSGGVDSTVAAVLLQKAIGPRLHCVFVDTGLLRHDEYAQVLAAYQGLGLNIIGVSAADQFLGQLAALPQPEDPEAKRKTIGRVFIEVFEDAARTWPEATHLVQGTIYPDVIESVSVTGPSVTIKSHHNVGGLPERMHLKVHEPLRYLFKDEVRRVGAELGIPATILHRHPFPGPGLAIRVLGAVTPERVALLQQADAVYLAALREFNLYDEVWQAFSVLLPVQSVGVMGDERTYENVLALRAVTSQDGMTADWARLPHDFLAEVSSRIINSVRGINRVVYDISSKPPATIEWE